MLMVLTIKNTITVITENGVSLLIMNDWPLMGCIILFIMLQIY